MEVGGIAEAVVRALAIELKVSEGAIRSARSLKRDLKMDSISAVNVAFALEEEYDVEIDIREGDDFDSLEQIVDVVERAVTSR